MSGKRTATPWTLTHIAGSNFAVQEFEIRGMFCEEQNVSPIFNKDRSAIDGATIFCSPGDAEFIVRAVNAHDDLLEALHAVDGAYRSGHDLNTVLDQVRAAIAKATGEQP